VRLSAVFSQEEDVEELNIGHEVISLSDKIMGKAVKQFILDSFHEGKKKSEEECYLNAIESMYKNLEKNVWKSIFMPKDGNNNEKSFYFT
jgi:predicted subunit of tRNA(5-methylaminomethyl-2-thiouridylate) methyltransferase